MSIETQLVELRKTEGRGKVLSTILVLQGVFSLLLLTQLPTLFTGGYSSSVIMLSLLMIALMIASAIGVWKWSKFGAYGIAVLSFLWIVEYVFFELPGLLNSPVNRDIPVLQLVGPVIVFYLVVTYLSFWSIKRKWHLFS